MVEQITLYTAKVCPYAHRVELALEEAGAQYKKFQIDLQNKPTWYQPQVNPASKVPAIAYGGPDVPPDQPSPDSVKLAESLVLLEFVADLFPSSTLLPSSPVQRAKVRFFIDAVSTRYGPPYFQFVIRGESAGVAALGEAIGSLQALIQKDGGKYAVGDEFTIADAALAPFLARLEVQLTNDLGAYKEGEGKAAWATLHAPEFNGFWSYFERVKERKSFKDTFDAEYIKEVFTKRFTTLRAQKQGA